MAVVKFYLEYKNQNPILLPVTPEELRIENPSRNETTQIITLGEINILKDPGLKEISIESFIPTDRTAPYVNRGASSYNFKFYVDFFNALQLQKEPINLVISQYNITLEVGLENFNYWWEGSDPDMHYQLDFKEWKAHEGSVAFIEAPISPAPAQETVETRENTSKVPTVGSIVLVNGRLHRDSYGEGPGQTEVNATRVLHIIKEGRSHPYHVITLDGGWRGWVTAGSVEVIS